MIKEISVKRTLMKHSGGTKFYDVILVRPSSSSGGVDKTRNAIAITRWGKIISSMTKGGSFGEGKLLNTSNNGYLTYFDKIISDKSSKGYAVAETTTYDGEDAYKFLQAKGVIDQLPDKQNYSQFFKQFDFLASPSSEGISEEEIDDSFTEIVVPQVAQKTRSPLYGSW